MCVFLSTCRNPKFRLKFSSWRGMKARCGWDLYGIPSVWISHSYWAVPFRDSNSCGFHAEMAIKNPWNIWHLWWTLIDTSIMAKQCPIVWTAFFVFCWRQFIEYHRWPMTLLQRISLSSDPRFVQWLNVALRCFNGVTVQESGSFLKWAKVAQWPF